MMTSSVRKNVFMATAGGVFLTLTVIGQAQAATVTPTLAPYFSNSYSITDLGSIEQIPLAYGGITFQPGEPNTLLISGLADTPDGGIYAVEVSRDSNNHITGFGIPSFLAQAPGISTGGIDAGLAYSPKGDVLFYTSYPDNSIGQIKPGSSAPNKQIDLNALDIASSTGALNFVPEGFAGAGQLKITSYTGSIFYDTTITSDGSGTYDIVKPTRSVQLDGGLDGFIYVRAGNPGFVEDSLLIEEYDNSSVSAYTIDANGNPIANTRRNFITGLGFHSPISLTGVMGATIDPVTGDFIFSTFFEGEPSVSKIYAVTRVTKSTSVPEPRGVTWVFSTFVLVLSLLRNKISRFAQVGSE
ncbi:hypothetical protein [Scytonema sp. NUACC26]|uniref:hypothetical protein n=1 Tax=Scytonema sp. NUACC26 TaxID=3140176 RepID=UPI0034DC1952